MSSSAVGRRVLLVDDYSDARDMYGEYLEYSGFEVIQAEDGIEALRKALDESPDIILMDLSLPIMDGWEATRRLKADERTATIPVVVLTGHALAGNDEGPVILELNGRPRDGKQFSPSAPPDPELLPAARVLDFHLRAKDEHRQALEHGGNEVFRELQQEALRDGNDQERREQAALGRAPSRQRRAPGREVLDVIGELRVKEFTRVRAGDRQ